MVAGLGVALGLVLSGTAASLLVDGHGTATITWRSAARTLQLGGRQAFTGNVESLALAGGSSIHITPSAGRTINFESLSLDVAGTAAGTAFHLVAHPYFVSLSPTPVGGFSVTGHFGKRAVTGTLVSHGYDLTSRITGTVGAYRVTGQVGEPVRHGHDMTVTATFDVSGG